ncbi:hypothetical protein [Bacillus thuringiensis]|uniref:hypothetical protein n=1 Tax=Bacillus thuringiensis TaxID=1428 RepID=UPI00211D2645|nr:hypothetical protein [Bacillus thuringiensis]
MDSVQQFIAKNSHQFGYIMQEAARQWAEKDPLGALTVGPCKGTVNVNGSYLELLDKLESIQKGNVYSCSIEMDTKEADKNVKELTAAANGCVESLERLGNAITNVGALMNSSNVEEVSRGDLINIMMKDGK